MKRLTLLSLSIMMTVIAAIAQSAPALPLDSAVRVGKLDNGLTYYIRYNNYPKNQADFFIAQKVGSVLEDDNQRGLAHFLEHMCFNGTANFPENQVVHWLETKGVKFGANLNAYTSIDETVYNISKVPTDNVAVQDSCLLILHDWACDLLLDSVEIDKERGVIHQEWRRSNQGAMRIIEELLPTVYPDSRYAYRLPIGTMEVVDNFAPQVLRDYYHKWYRPDLQGIIVVGDIDVDRTESKIKEIFGSIPAPVNPAERVYYAVPDTKGRIFAIGKDSEMPNASIDIMIKHDALPDSLNNTLNAAVARYMFNMLTSMFNARLSDMTSDPATPFASSSTSYGNFFLARTKDAFDIDMTGKGDSITPSFEAVYRELLRVKRHGFTVGEYQRAKAKYMASVEQAYNNRSTITSTAHARTIIRHFLENKPATDMETTYQLAQMLTQAIPVDQINAMLPELLDLDDNVVIMAMLPDTETFAVPTADELAAIMARVEAEDIEPYKDDTKSEPLIPQLPAPGSIVETKQLPQYDATEWTLSNGAKVIAKITDFKDDEVIMTGIARGGYSTTTASPSDIIFMPYAMWQSGLGDYTSNDLEKYLAGKRASVKPSLRELYRSVNGQCAPKDIATLMELLYMTFTAYNITPDEFAATQAMIKGYLQNQLSTPNYIFGREYKKYLSESPYEQEIDIEAIDGAKLETTLGVIRDMLSAINDFTFVFVGNLDLETLKPLVEQYIASIPVKPTTAGVNMDMIKERSGSATEIINTAMTTPQTTAIIEMKGEAEPTLKNKLLASVAGQILSQRLINKIREEMGAVYSISASGSLSRIEREASIASEFPMKPEMRDEVLANIAQIINEMAQEVKPEELSKVQEYLTKTYTEMLRRNEYWLQAMQEYGRFGSDLSLGSIEAVSQLTVDDVQNFVKSLLDQNNYIVFIQDPK